MVDSELVRRERKKSRRHESNGHLWRWDRAGLKKEGVAANGQYPRFRNLQWHARDDWQLPRNETCQIRLAKLNKRGCRSGSGLYLEMDPAEHVLLRRLRQAVQAYSKSLQDQPVLTKALTAYVAAKKTLQLVWIIIAVNMQIIADHWKSCYSVSKPGVEGG